MTETITEKIQYRVEDGIGWLVFNNPSRHNAMSLAMWEAVPRVIEKFLADNAVRVIVLRGAGERAFDTPESHSGDMRSG